jgi:hypothetical protein
VIVIRLVSYFATVLLNKALSEMGCPCVFLPVDFVDPIYSAYHRFMKDLFRDGAVRTEDPWTANLFYVPAFMCARFDGQGSPCWFYVVSTSYENKAAF